MLARSSDCIFTFFVWNLCRLLENPTLETRVYQQGEKLRYPSYTLGVHFARPKKIKWKAIPTKQRKWVLRPTNHTFYIQPICSTQAFHPVLRSQKRLADSHRSWGLAKTQMALLHMLATILTFTPDDLDSFNRRRARASVCVDAILEAHAMQVVAQGFHPCPIAVDSTCALSLRLAQGCPRHKADHQVPYCPPMSCLGFSWKEQESRPQDIQHLKTSGLMGMLFRPPPACQKPWHVANSLGAFLCLCGSRVKGAIYAIWFLKKCCGFRCSWFIPMFIMCFCTSIYISMHPIPLFFVLSL